VIEHGTRRIRVLGATGHPVQSWVVQQARNLLMDLDDAGMSVKFVLHDWDASFTAAFDAVLQAAGVRIIRSAVQAPWMNSIMERWIGSCRRELLDRTLIWNQRHFMTVLREYEDFCNTHRAAPRLEPSCTVPPAARRRHQLGPPPCPAARPRRRRDSRIWPGGIDVRHSQAAPHWKHVDGQWIVRPRPCQPAWQSFRGCGGHAGHQAPDLARTQRYAGQGRRK